MTPQELKDAMTAAGITRQVDLRRLIEHLSGASIGNTTINRWIKGTREIPPTAAALVNLLAGMPARQTSDLIRQARENDT